MKHGHERAQERLRKEVRAELEARFERIVEELRNHPDRAKAVLPTVLMPQGRIRKCPKCGTEHTGTSKKGWCLWCLNQYGWKKGGGEAFRARCAGVKPVWYDESDPTLAPMEGLQTLEDPYALDTGGDSPRSASPGPDGRELGVVCGTPAVLRRLARGEQP